MESEDTELKRLLHELNSAFKTMSERIALLSSLVILLGEPRLLSCRCSSVIGLYFLYHLVPFNPLPQMPAFSLIYSFYLGFDPSPERSLVLWLLSTMRHKLDHCTARRWLKMGTGWDPDQSQLLPSEIYVINRIESLHFESKVYLMIDQSRLDEIFNNTKRWSGSRLAISFFSELRNILQKKLCYSDTPQTCEPEARDFEPSPDHTRLSAHLEKAIVGPLTKYESELLSRNIVNLPYDQLESIHLEFLDIQNLIRFNKDIAVTLLCAKLKTDQGSR